MMTIPAKYIVETNLYQSFLENGDGEVNLNDLDQSKLLYDEPTSYEIADTNDFMKKLDIFKYWTVAEYPDCYYDFIFKNYKEFEFDDTDLLDDIFDLYKINLTPIIQILKINDIFMLNKFVKIGNLGWIKYLRKIGYSINGFAFTDAIESNAVNSLEVIKWLYENEFFSLDERIFETAAGSKSKNSVEIMKWLKENGCPWNKNAFKSASENGNIKAMRWLIDSGCIKKDEFI